MMYKKLQALRMGEVQPSGWLKRQLEIQAEGLSGELHERWESVGTYSGWLGGTGENWERGPYFLDGILPLAFYLKNEKLYGTAEKFINWTLNSQDEEGNFGPEESKHDWWPRMVMLKVLVQYYEITHKNEVIHFMRRYFKYQLKNLNKNPLEGWGKARCADLIFCIKWLYEQEPEPYLPELAKLVLEQSDNWNQFLEKLPFTRPTEYYYKWSNMENMSKNLLWEVMRFHQTHVVNVTMGMKYPAMASWVKDQDYREVLKKGIRDLQKYHGVVTGAINGDEHLAGNSPVRGAELCSIAEYMFSLQVALEIFGDAEFADLLERLAYNAYPAMFTEDYMGHQYLQQVNQIAATNELRPWYNNLNDSNTFGLEPNFGCCTANMHQGWPKFIKSLWYKEENGIVSMVFAPNELRTKVNRENVKIDVVTEYPADLTVRYVVKEVGEQPFSLKIRLPKWCRSYELYCDDKEVQHIREDGFIKIYRKFQKGETIRVCFHAEVEKSTWYHGSVALERGPLVFALDLNEKWEVYREKGEFRDYEIRTEDTWNYALIKGEKVSVAEGTCGKVPFQKERPPVILETKGRRLESWGKDGGNAGELPISPVKAVTEKKTIRLIPFGCTHLRIAQFPVCEE